MEVARRERFERFNDIVQRAHRLTREDRRRTHGTRSGQREQCDQREAVPAKRCGERFRIGTNRHVETVETHVFGHETERRGEADDAARELIGRARHGAIF